jgi:hypothetical protein
MTPRLALDALRLLGANTPPLSSIRLDANAPAGGRVVPAVENVGGGYLVVNPTSPAWLAAESGDLSLLAELLRGLQTALLAGETP